MSEEQDEQEKVVVDAEDVREVVRWWGRMSEKDKREMSGPAFNLMRKLDKALEARHPKPPQAYVMEFNTHWDVRIESENTQWDTTQAFIGKNVPDAERWAHLLAEVLNGGTQEPVAWRMSGGALITAGHHNSFGESHICTCTPLFAGPQVGETP